MEEKERGERIFSGDKHIFFPLSFSISKFFFSFFPFSNSWFPSLSFWKFSRDPNNQATMLSLQQSDPRLVHHGQYLNQPPPPPLPQQQLQLAPYGEDLSALHSDVTSAGASSSSGSVKHSQPLDSREGFCFFPPLVLSIASGLVSSVRCFVVRVSKQCCL